ncbi:thiol-specific monooxygenase [Saccharata proteae CBS 121410]|uniref:Thiol-specific monooxygenase n=1 Tax=Saccharata proteae CBS 121410 TaxID=1314787 RepID=A0A9P4HVH6_9PEZI|nr:thiol-specific monooxygenase [Saccharata proteae CBS 121410]
MAGSKNGATNAGRQIDTVAIVGAGPGGLAAAKYLLAEETFSRIELFEQRNCVGGVWHYTPHKALDSDFSIPHTKPRTEAEEPFMKEGIWSTEAEFVSPLYEHLETNIPHSLMNYSDLRFPEKTPLFPSHTIVKEYIERYAEDVRHLIKFQTQVIDVSPVDEEDGKSQWAVKFRELQSGNEETQIFDAVVVANGHYSDPYIPDIPGLTQWNDAYPDAISHSKYYNKPFDFAGQKVVVVGNSASGLDISGQISHHSLTPVLVAERSLKAVGADDTNSILELPEIAEFVPNNRTIRFANGRVEQDIDAVVFCTGYLYSFPFLKHLDPPVVEDGSRVMNVYEQIFYTPRPTLAFVGLPQRIVPFPISEGQGAAIARTFSGRLSLPSPAAMREWEDKTVAERGADKRFHNLAFPRDAQYLNHLHDWAMSAEEGETRGKRPPYWDEQKQWIRERFPLIKLASRMLGEGRHDVKTLEEIGFDYEKWLKEGDEANPLV